MQIDRSLRWDIRNRWLIGYHCCHWDHHHRGTRDARLPYNKVPKAALAFAHEVLGSQAAMYFYRRYKGAPRPILQSEED